MKKEAKSTREFDFSSLCRTAEKFWIVLLVAAIVFAVGGALFTHVFTDDQYVGTARFWVNGSTNQNTTSSATMGAAQMATNYVNLVLESDNLLEKAVTMDIDGEDLCEKWNVDYSTAKARLSAMIGAGKSDEDSFLFYVNVRSSSRAMTAEAIIALQQAVVDEITEVNNAASIDSSEYVTMVEWVEDEGDVSKIAKPYLRNIAIASAAAFIIAYAICFIIHVRDTVVYDEASLKDKFEHPVVGSIPGWNASGDAGTKEKKRGIRRRRDFELSERDYSGRLINASTPFSIKEAFNMLRTNVSYTVVGKKVPVFAVTSAHSGAGKSLISSNLAVSFATLGKKTLIIECDMRCPVFGRIFGISGEGLSEQLAGIATKNYINEYTDTLSVVVAGRTPPNPSELLASDTMRRLIDAEKENYDVIILDTPPICEVTDAGVLSEIVDGYILAVRSGYSDIKAVESATKLLGAVNANIVGFILNDVNPKNNGSDGYYYSKKGRYATYSERANKSE